MGVGRLSGPAMGRVVLGGVAFHMEKTLKLPSSLSLFRVKSPLIMMVWGCGGQLPQTVSCIPGGILPEKKNPNISPLSHPGSQAEVWESISQG